MAKYITTAYIRDNYYKADLRTIRELVKKNFRYTYVNSRMLVLEEDVLDWLNSADRRKHIS